MPKIIFKCAICNIALTKQLSELEYKSQLQEEDGCDHIPLGFYAVEDGEYYSQAKGQYVVNLKDLINTKHHPDPKRLNGCCGLDGCDGMNTICINGHEVGTERSDCWIAHAITFDRTAVWLDRIWLETS